MNRSERSEQGKRHYRKMTVAHIREHKDEDYVEVIFLESARFYRLFRTNPMYSKALGLLRDALTKGRIVKVGLTTLDSDIIEEVQEPTSSASE